MKNKYFQLFLILIIIYTLYIFLLKKPISSILLSYSKKIHQYSIFFKNNTQIFKLIHDYNILNKEYNKLNYLKNEIEMYKNKINNYNTYHRNFLPAEIIGYINNKKHKYFFINRGLLDNIQENMIVINGITILGRITKVYSYYSKVIFLDNNEQYISVVFNKNNIKGILKGNRNNEEGTMSLIHIYNDTKDCIEVGEKVYSSGKGLLFPPGYLIGTVKKINKINCLENNIIITNDYDINNIYYCDIIIDEKTVDDEEKKELTEENLITSNPEEIN